MAITGLTIIDAANALTNWANQTGSTDTISTANPAEGSGAVAHRPDTNARFYERITFPGGSIDLSGQGRFYFWCQMLSGSYVPRITNKDAANPGLSVRLSDGTNWSEWNFAGQDAYEATHPTKDSGWTRYCVDPLDGSPDATSGTLSTSAVTLAEFRITRDVSSTTWVSYDLICHGEGLRIDAGTVGTPNDFQDLLDNDVTNVWGVLLQTRSDEIQQLGNLAFGTPSGSTDTHFKDETGKNFNFGGTRGAVDLEFAIYDETNTNPRWEILRGGTGETHFQVGTNTIVGGVDVVSNGVGISTPQQGRYDIICTDANIDEIKFYGCTFKNGNTFTMGDGTTQIDNMEAIGCIFDTMEEVILDLGSASKFRSIVTNGNATDALSIHGVATGVIQNTISSSNTRGITFHESGTFDATNLTLLNNTTDVYFNHPSGTVTLSLINSTSDPTTGQVDNARAWDITEETLYNANVSSGGSPLQNARVRLTNTAGTEEFSVLTDASGDITEQNVVRRTQEHSSGLPKASPTETVHTPFTKEIRFADQIPQSIAGFMPGEVTVSDSFILLDEPFFTDSVATVAAFTGIAINEATTPDRIEVTEDHTINEVFEWLRWYTAGASGDHLSDPMQTADGVTYTVADYDFLVSGSGVVLDLEGGTVSMSTKAFTLAADGTISDGIVIDSTETLYDKTVSFEAVDDDNAAIASVLVTAYKVSDDTEIINTTTAGSGIASTTYSDVANVDIYYRYRKASTGATKYFNLSGFATITSGGSVVKRSMKVDTIADPTI